MKNKGLWVAVIALGGCMISVLDRLNKLEGKDTCCCATKLGVQPNKIVSGFFKGPNVTKDGDFVDEDKFFGGFADFLKKYRETTKAETGTDKAEANTDDDMPPEPTINDYIKDMDKCKLEAEEPDFLADETSKIEKEATDGVEVTEEDTAENKKEAHFVSDDTADIEEEASDMDELEGADNSNSLI